MHRKQLWGSGKRKVATRALPDNRIIMMVKKIFSHFTQILGCFTASGIEASMC